MLLSIFSFRYRRTYDLRNDCTLVVSAGILQLTDTWLHSPCDTHLLFSCVDVS